MEISVEVFASGHLYGVVSLLCHIEPSIKNRAAILLTPALLLNISCHNPSTHSAL